MNKYVSYNNGLGKIKINRETDTTIYIKRDAYLRAFHKLYNLKDKYDRIIFDTDKLVIDQDVAYYYESKKKKKKAFRIEINII